jgi:hypothetical protein
MASCRRRHEDHAGTASVLMACGLDAFAWTMLGQSVRVLLSLSLGRPKAPSRHLPACPISRNFVAGSCLLRQSCGAAATVVDGTHRQAAAERRLLNAPTNR